GITGFEQLDRITGDPEYLRAMLREARRTHFRSAECLYQCERNLHAAKRRYGDAAAEAFVAALRGRDRDAERAEAAAALRAAVADLDAAHARIARAIASGRPLEPEPAADAS
ncbi:MAG: hypothetical protein KGL54_15085, partial [Sphingomonadales bacterium]|nr:hypothetical protein [Sphingomonadales bacterium]